MLGSSCASPTPRGGAPARHRGTLGITGRNAYSIVTDLIDAGYVVKDKDGRRNRYQIQTHLPLREAITQERTIGEVLDVLVESKIRRPARRALG